ncbi:MAG: hypothetical protein ACT4PY_06825 [Armatimonadota bacterium]
MSVRTSTYSTNVGKRLGPGIVFVAIAGVIGSFIAIQDIEGMRAAVIIAGVVMASLVIFHLASRDDPIGTLLFRLLIVALFLKFGAIVFRLWFIFDQYGGFADAVGYHGGGSRAAAAILAGGSPDITDYHGTDMVTLITGIFYLFTGPTLIGAFVFWAWLGLLGMLFFYKAFVTAVPNGNRRLFAYLIMLYPSMALWTSSLGKDALVCFCLGLGTYGAARLMRRIALSSLVIMGVGLGGVMVIRPHVAGIIGVAVAAASVWRPARAGLLTPMVRIAVVLVFAVVAIFVVQTSAGYIQLDDLTPDGVLSYIEDRQERTERGGAAIHRVVPTNPIAFVDGLSTVFFRPFPWEAHNAFAMISAVEGIFLILLFFRKWKSLAAAVAAAPGNAFMMLAVVFILLFAFFFSGISNFAIIARQRPQLLPFIFMLLAYLPPRPTPQLERL